ncbi:MAG: transglutaminase domain-containing protein [Devosia sp.]
MKVILKHTLRFTLGGSPARAVQHLLLSPANTPQQRVEGWSIDVPGIADAAVFRDGFGNRAHLVSHLRPEGEIVVVAGGTVVTLDKAGVLGRLEYDHPPGIFRRTTALTRADADATAGINETDGRIALLHELMERVHEWSEAASAGVSQSQDTRAGQTQSSGSTATSETAPEARVHRFIAAARSLGIPSRYVVGYLLEDASARLHAWAEAWDEGLGWIGFDPGLNLCPTDSHIRIAAGLDATGTAPIRSVPTPDEPIESTVELSVLDAA